MNKIKYYLRCIKWLWKNRNQENNRQKRSRMMREVAEGVSNTYSLIREEAERVRAERLAKENKQSEGI